MPYSNPEPRVAIIILNWSRWHDTLRCLESVYQSTYVNFCVVLVDNGSSDGSVEKVKQWAGGELAIDSEFNKYSTDNKPVRMAIVSNKEAAAGKDLQQQAAGAQLSVILNEKNQGFARGNNIGIRYAAKIMDVRYIMLLNNDTIVLPDCIEELVRTAEHETRAGSYQPKMLAMDASGTIDTVGISMRNAEMFAIAIGHGLQDGEEFSRGMDIFGVCAGAALYRKDMLDRIGLFDEDFFAYYEDVDLAFRARLKGWSAAYVPTAVVYHGHSATLGKEAPLKTRLLERNRYYCIIKNAPKAVMMSFLKKRPGVFRNNFEHLVRSKKFPYALAYALGNLEALARLPKFFVKRLRNRVAGNINDVEIMKWFSP